MKRRIAYAALLAFVAYGIALYVTPLFFSLPERLEQGPPRGLLFVDRNGEPVRSLLAAELRAANPTHYLDTERPQ